MFYEREIRGGRKRGATPSTNFEHKVQMKKFMLWSFAFQRKEKLIIVKVGRTRLKEEDIGDDKDECKKNWGDLDGCVDFYLQWNYLMNVKEKIQKC
jgi:hypothetical protein